MKWTSSCLFNLSGQRKVTVEPLLTFNGRRLSDGRWNDEKITLRTNKKHKKKSVNLTQNFSISQEAFFFIQSHSVTDHGLYCHLISDGYFL